MSFDLSVVIPTFKRTDSLKLIIEKLKHQISLSIEIIVVNQNVDDFFPSEILEELKTIKHIKLPNPNASLARNVGFKSASAGYILFIDDDLVPDKNFCVDGLNVFKKYKAIKCFSPNVYNYQGKEIWFNYAQKNAIKTQFIDKDTFAIKDTMSACIFFESEYFRESGGFDPYLFDFARTAEDQEFFLRMTKNNQTLWFTNSVSIFHNEKVAGGCDLRTDDYWVTRKRCINSWALRYRLHNKHFGQLSLNDLLALMRSAFLNKQVLKLDFKRVAKNIQLLIAAIKESKVFFKSHIKEYCHDKFNYL